jgi:hypothetical protein
MGARAALVTTTTSWDDGHPEDLSKRSSGRHLAPGELSDKMRADLGEIGSHIWLTI